MNKSEQNVLLIGDLRTAKNYGAIATSESLINLLKEKVDQKHLKLIEYRSFQAETPIDGWPEVQYASDSSAKSKAKNLLNKTGLMNTALKLTGSSKNAGEYHVPVRFSDFDNFSIKVLSGEKLPFEKKMIDWADIVIINSEGNIVNGTDANGVYRLGGLYVLYMAYFSKVIMKKKCYIINHTVDPANRDIREMIIKIYPLLDGVYVREKLSDALLKSWGLSNQRYVPDALFSHDFNSNININDNTIMDKWGDKIDFSKPYICLGDSSGIKNKYNKVKWDVVATYNMLIQELKKNVCQQIIFIDGFNGFNTDIQHVINTNSLVQAHLDNCSFEELYFILKRAQLFISGRWHASIISLKAHTPILLFGSDSHKTEALYHEIDWPFYFFDTKTVPLNISRICNIATDILNYDCTEVWKEVDQLALKARQNVDMLLYFGD